MGEPSKEAAEITRRVVAIFGRHGLVFDEICAELQKLIDDRDQYKKLADAWGNNYAHFASLSSLRLRWSGRWKKLAKALRERAEAAEKEVAGWKELHAKVVHDMARGTEEWREQAENAEGQLAGSRMGRGYDKMAASDALASAEERVRALEAKCDLLAASLKQADVRSEAAEKRVTELESEVAAEEQAADHEHTMWSEMADERDAALASKAELIREVRQWVDRVNLKEICQSYEHEGLCLTLYRHESAAPEHPDTARLRELAERVKEQCPEGTRLWDIANEYDRKEGA